MTNEQIPNRVAKAISGGYGGPILQAKRVLGNRMRWLGNPSNTSRYTAHTCWELDGAGTHATEKQILYAAGMVRGADERKIVVYYIPAEALEASIHDADQA